MRVVATLVLAGGVWLSAGAQEPKTPPKPADKAPAKADKGDKNEPVPGRKTRKIEGFTFLISDEALKAAAAAKDERPPLEVLEYECKLLTKMLSPRAVDLLRQLTVFVDWDEKVALGNGRTGTALATYYNSSAAQTAREGRHPRQAKTVTIHSLKALTAGRQPDDDTGTGCLLLHEFAHAVHDQLFGFDHPRIKAAYEQAMERKLYDREFYSVTDVREFFAEMTCAYLDRLEYLPHNRDELRRHDPETFKAMEWVWAGSAAAKGAKPPPPPHAEPRDLDLKLADDVKLGPVLAGPKPPADLTGKVVLLGYWGGRHTNVLDRLDRLQGELGDYGLVALGAHAYVRDDDLVKADAEKRAPRAAALKAAFAREGQEYKTQPAGHVLVFNPAGRCVHRGSAYDADEPVRAAVGKALLAAALGPGESPRAFKPVADAFAAGGTPPSVVSKLTPLLTSADEDVKAKAKKLNDLILAPGQKALVDAQKAAKADPVDAFLAAEKLSATFKNTPVGTKAAALVTNLRVEKAVAAEVKARAQAAEVEKLAGRLRGQEGSVNPLSPEFQTRNKGALGQLKAQLDALRKQHPNAKAVAEAEKAAAEFGVQ